MYVFDSLRPALPLVLVFGSHSCLVLARQVDNSQCADFDSSVTTLPAV